MEEPMKKIAALGAVMALLIVIMVVYTGRERQRREALDRKLFPYQFERLPRTPKYKTHAEALREGPARLEAGCRALRAKIAEKRVGDLTVRETEMLSVCRTLGM
jgi:hypothetical protein